MSFLRRKKGSGDETGRTGLFLLHDQPDNEANIAE
jgi:hypothetical protein